MDSFDIYITRKLPLVGLISAVFIVYPNIACIPWELRFLKASEHAGFLAFFVYRFFFFWGLICLLIHYNLKKMPAALFRQRLMRNFLFSLVAYLIYASVSYGVSSMGIHTDALGSILIFQFFVTCFLCTFIGYISMLYSRQREKESEIERLRFENLQSRCDALANQINPHFFMNTLNNIHALIDFDTDSAKSAVIELSKMMRYVLYDSENAETSILNDIRFVENYIGLMRIRYTDDVDIRLDVEGTVPPEAKIPPLLLIVFVENAFKHGVSYNSPSYVHIAISCDGNTASCTVTNSRHDHTAAHDLQAMAAADTHAETDTKASSRTARRGRKSRIGRSGGNRLSGVNAASDGGKSSGMGLYNVRKRLDLLFGSNYTLKIDDSHEDRYEVKLTIPIKYD